ncbi:MULTISPECIES: AAA family ATPase [Micromonospora]|uniref:Cytidylate kinase n=1 Tax=Micromonospora chalcea TaxID=1874 RepID=A0ABX9Y0Z5_MICCH|nr:MULTISPECIES: AAA family ATPase [Micromonospora]NHO81573.1 AAA family ATPase [Micromonospora sp. CMU55-4]ODB80566.1 cytidylate kinase [Micromonospora sp. II]RQW88876.1 cytidylate kinase [Micromonospora chalcea]RQX53313.1 cytidylate kinase [Micromonospora chalcea]WBB82603.1 AAA family ATPase [Micromonospora sp. WMMC264]
MTVRQSIVFNGDLGSGKSTVSVEIAKRLGLRRVSVGDLYRQMAQERQMTALQLNLHAELDQAVDGYVDQLQRDIAASGESLVMDSRLAWHFFTDALKVHMITEPTEAARRVLARPSGPAESYTSLEEARTKLRERSESERGRFIVRYGVDKARLRNYDLICDTTRANPEQVIQHVIDVYEGRLGADVLRAGQPLLLLDPTRVYPTEDVSALRGLWDADLAAELAESGEEPEPLSIGYTGEYFFVVDGHRRLSSAVRAGLPMVPARLVAEVDEPVVGGMSAVEFFTTQARPGLIHDWEDAHGITLPLPEHALLDGGPVLAGEPGAGA